MGLQYYRIEYDAEVHNPIKLSEFDITGHAALLPDARNQWPPLKNSTFAVITSLWSSYSTLRGQVLDEG